MERRGQEQDLGIPNYTAQQIIQESSPVKLPLAPIFSTPPERIRGNAMASTRRGCSIFSPSQTLDPPQHHRQLSPLPPHQPPVQKEPTTDPDPPTPTTAAASNSKITPPPRPPPPPPQPATGAATGNTATRYRECLKNHAASMGGHVVDGCGEFMPGGEEGLEALRCAACDCHRNFHRKEINGGGAQQARYNNTSRQSPLLQTQPPTTHHKRSHSFATSSGGGGAPSPAMMNFAGNSAGTAAESSSEDLNTIHHQQSKKRFRTKFNQDQKDRMHEFASKIGWRIQKKDDEEVKQFCSEVGVQRQVFKVWMHNIKQAMKKKESDT